MRKVILLIGVLFLLSGCGDNGTDKVHKELYGDSRVGVIMVDSQCFILYYAGFGRGIAPINCPEGENK